MDLYFLLFIDKTTRQKWLKTKGFPSEAGQGTYLITSKGLSIKNIGVINDTTRDRAFVTLGVCSIFTIPFFICLVNALIETSGKWLALIEYILDLTDMCSPLSF